MELSNIFEKDKKNTIKQRNLGIEVLRMVLCFRIVLLHYYSLKNLFIRKLKRNRFQVPCFFFISFYFLYPTISQRNEKKLKLRLERLLIPYIIHPIFNWIINNIMFIIVKFNRYNRLLTLNDLKTQIIVGRGIYGISVLWFHFNLILFTIFFFIFSFMLKTHFLTFFQVIALISYSLVYSEFNYKYFKQYTENVWMSVGNLTETFPIAIYGFTLSSINVYQILLKKREKVIFFSIIFFYLISYYHIFVFVKGFSSPGIYQIFNSTCLFSFFSLLPLEKLNLPLLLFIKQITKYTQGIYCLHFLFQYYMKLKFDKSGSFMGCIILYMFSYFISFIGFNVFSKTKLKFLFS